MMLLCAIAGELSASDKIKINVRQSDAAIRAARWINALLGRR
jgi:hypothetical protein